MNSKSKRLLSTLLVVALAFSVIVAVSSTANAGSEFTLATPTTPPQGYFDSISDLAKYINEFNPGGSGRLTASVSGSTITVTGNVNNANKYLPFTLKNGWLMVWKATYKGTIATDYMIQVTSEANSSGKHSELRVEGTIGSSGRVALGSQFATIRVAGGNVYTDNSAWSAIEVYDGEVIVSGDSARVSSQNGNAIAVYQGRGIAISGGQVYCGQTGMSAYHAIDAVRTTIKITGGFVFSLTRPYLLPGHTTDITDVIRSTNVSDITVSGSGVVCVYDNMFGEAPTEYIDGSSTNLWVKPAGEATWTSGGIAYNDGDLFPISGITTYQAFTVTFNSNGGSAVDPVTLKANTKLTPPSNPTRSGYFFNGWYRDSALTQEFDFDASPIHNNLTLYAKWTSSAPGGLIILDPAIKEMLMNRRTVIFESNGGSAIANKTVSKGNPVEKPANPIRLLADFDGWYADEALTQPYDFSTLVEEDITLYAKWRTKQVIQYESTGGSAVTFEYNGEKIPYQVVYTGSPATAPDDPQMSNFAFAGWYLDLGDTTPYDFSTPVTEHLTLYAKWAPVDPTVTPEIPSTGMDNFTESKIYTSGQFTDVNEDEWYGYNAQQTIANAYRYDLMEGNSSTTFNPTGNITLAEAITVAARVHSIYSTGTRFSAVSDPWYQAYVDYAIEAGLIAANDFTDYNATATRAEMAYIFSKSLPSAEFAPRNTVNSLPDVNNGTPYSAAIFMLYKAGVVGGNDSQGTFAPGNSITRAEAAAIISRVIIPATRLSGKTFG